MKSIGYIILALIFSITITPNTKIEQVKIESISIDNKSEIIDSLRIISDIKTESLEKSKEELKQLQIELGIRK